MTACGKRTRVVEGRESVLSSSRAGQGVECVESGERSMSDGTGSVADGAGRVCGMVLRVMPSKVAGSRQTWGFLELEGGQRSCFFHSARSVIAPQ